MANKVDLGCKQLRGTFQMSGKVSGRLSQGFFTEGTSSNGKAYRKCRFGVEIEQGKTVYMDLFGAASDYCYISKRTTLPGGKTQNDTQQIPWSKRFDFEKDPKYKGYQMIGVTCGCKKVTDEKGVTKNQVLHLTPYDACDEIQNLRDNQSIFVRGNIEYQTYNGTHRVNFVPTQVSLCKDIDFDDMDYVCNARFTQPLVLMGVTKNEDTPGEAIVNAKIINYASVEDCELYTRNAALAKNLKKLGAFCHIKVFGDIILDGQIEEVVESSEWGLPNKMERVASPFKRKLLITGADPDTIDKEAYSEEVINHAIEVAAGIQNAKNDYGMKDDANEGWGNKPGNRNNFDDLDDDIELDLGI